MVQRVRSRLERNASGLVAAAASYGSTTAAARGSNSSANSSKTPCDPPSPPFTFEVHLSMSMIDLPTCQRASTSSAQSWTWMEKPAFLNL